MFKRYCVVVGLIALILTLSVAIPVEAFQTTPADGAMNVPIDGSIVIDFDDSMRVGSVIVDINPDMVYPMEKRWSNDDRTLTLTPMAGFINEQTYTVNVVGTNITGNVTDQTFSFTIETAPGIMESLSDFFYGIYAGFIGSLYGILIFLVLIIVGFIVAWAVKKVTYKILDKSPLDQAMKKVGVEKDVQKVGIKSVSSLISQLMFWFIFVMCIQIALDYAGIVTLIAILTPIVLFIPRIIIAVIIMIVGLYVAELVVDQIKKILAKGPIGEKFKEMDQKVKTSGFSIYDFLFIFVKVFILLIFVQVALSILAISILSTFITPVILFMPLLLTALIIVFIGLIVADYVVKVLEGLLKEMEFNKLVDPVEAIVKRQGIIMKVLSWVVQALVVLVFLQIAVGVLNSTGAFNALATLINSVILWIPSLIVAILIGLLGFWIATWANDKVLAMGKDKDIPLYSMIAKIVQLSIIYMAITMALAQAGIEVPMLYLVFALAVGAIMIGVGVGVAYGSKDIFHNVIGNLQSSQTLKVGQRVKIEEYEGTIEEIGRYQLTLNTPTGKLHIPHSKVSKAVILTKD